MFEKLNIRGIFCLCRKKEVGPLKIFKYLNALKVKDLDHDGSDVHGELVHNTPLYEAYDSNLKLSRELNFGDFMRLKQQREDDELHNKESKRLVFIFMTSYIVSTFILSLFRQMSRNTIS